MLGTKDRRVDVLFSKKDTWVAETAYLRDLLLTFPFAEAFKWRAACYTFEGSNVAMIFRLKDSCGISLLRGALLVDPAGLLERPGPNSQSARYIKIRSLEEVRAKHDQITALVADAIKHHKAGDKVEFKAKEALEYPDELSEALADDQDLSAAFDALTPGRKRSWVIHIAGAKQSATRVNRIAKGRAKILAGKGQSEY